MEQMTIEQLEKIGIISVGDRAYPDRFYIEGIGDFTIKKPYSMKAIFQMIWEDGNRAGVITGKDQKIMEIKKVLQID